MKEVTEAEFNERKRLSEERRAAKQQAAEDRAKAIACGEEVEPILRNGKQGAGYWTDGVYTLDPVPSPAEYTQLLAKHAASFPQRDPEATFIALLAAKFPHLAHLEKEEFLTAVCSRLFINDSDKLLSRTCQMLETLTGHTPCGTLVSRYRNGQAAIPQGVAVHFKMQGDL